MTLLCWSALDGGELTVCLTDITDWDRSFLHPFSRIGCGSGLPWCCEVLEKTSVKPDHPQLGQAEGKRLKRLARS